MNTDLPPAAPVRLGPTGDASGDRPLGDLASRLVELWEECLGRPVNVTQNFFDLSDDQATATAMLEKLADRLGVKASAADLLRAPTIERLAKLLQKVEPSSSPQRLVQIQKGSADSIPFFFLHGDKLNGGVYCQKLVRCLGAGQRFIVIHPHGLQEPFVVPGSIEAMAAENVRDLLSFQSEGPYVLGGFCNGTVVAFEMAQQLRRQGKRVEAVVLILAPPESWLQPYSPLALADALRGKAGRRRSFDLRDVPVKYRPDRLMRVFGRLYLRYRFKPFPGRLLVINALDDPLIADFVEMYRSPAAILRFYLGRLCRRLGLPRLARRILGPKLGPMGGAMRDPSALHALVTVSLGQRVGPMDWRPLGEEVIIKETLGGHELMLVRPEVVAEHIKKHVPLTRTG